MKRQLKRILKLLTVLLGSVFVILLVIFIGAILVFWTRVGPEPAPDLPLPFESYALGDMGNVIRVPENHNSIQTAIDAAGDGDAVLVAPGTYKENIDFKGKEIIVTSETGPDETIIDGGRAASVVSIQSGENSGAVFHGFTVTNGLVMQGSASGGGLYIENANPTISQVIIHKNGADFGAGIYVGGEQARPLIKNSVISSNIAHYHGGGIAISHGAMPAIKNNIISNNASEKGGGINVSGESNPVIEGNAITNNVAGDDFYPEDIVSYLDGEKKLAPDLHGSTPGGVLVLQHSDPVIRSNTITGNEGGGIGVYFGSAPLIEDNVIEKNSNNGVGAISGGILITRESRPEVRNNIISHSWRPALWMDDTSLINGNNDRESISDHNEINGDIVLWPLKPPERKGPLSQETIQVPEDYTSIQRAIKAAADGDTIIVAPGVYRENLDFLGKEITVRSQDPGNEAVVAATVLEARDEKAIVTFIQGESRDATLDGFTIKNPHPGGRNLIAGVYVDGASPTISRNVIEAMDMGILMKGSPTAPLYEPNSLRERFFLPILYFLSGVPYSRNLGGETDPLIKENIIIDSRSAGILGYHFAGEIVGNLIEGNGKGIDRGGVMGMTGGGIFGWASYPTIIGNTIINNDSPYLGGGIYFESYSNPVIKDNVIADNRLGWIGGGIYIDSPCYVVIDSNVITGNEMGIRLGFETQALVTNNVIANNSIEGMHVGGSSQAEVINNTFADNYKDESGRYSQGLFVINRSVAEITNSIFYNSAIVLYDENGQVTVSHSLIYDGSDDYVSWPGEGKIFEDPMFIGNGDYRLRPDSPAIDAGAEVNIYLDIDGNKRPQGQGFDMGAYEHIE